MKSHCPKTCPQTKALRLWTGGTLLKEKLRLINEIDEFHTGGAAHVTHHPHPFYGFLTPMEWSIGMWKHLDHHLRQFDV